MCTQLIAGDVKNVFFLITVGKVVLAVLGVAVARLVTESATGCILIVAYAGTATGRILIVAYAGTVVGDGP